MQEFPGWEYIRVSVKLKLDSLAFLLKLLNCSLLFRWKRLSTGLYAVRLTLANEWKRGTLSAFDPRFRFNRTEHISAW